MQFSPPAADGSFPPPGWLTREQAANRLGLRPRVLNNSRWRWRSVLAEHSARMPKPTGWSCVVYPVELIERIAAERAREIEARRPEGFVSIKEARAMFGVSDPTWREWTQQGIVPEPRRLPKGATGRGPRMLYAL